MTKKFLGIANKAIAISDAVYDCDLDIPFTDCPPQEIILEPQTSKEKKIIFDGFKNNPDGTTTLRIKK